MSAGGRTPLWSSDGKTLYYVNLDERLMASSYSVANGSFSPSTARMLPIDALYNPTGEKYLDIAPDGASFIISRPTQASREPVKLSLLVHLTGELSRRLPK